MDGVEPPGSARPTDPRTLRALAHPIRLALLGLLRREGPLTATRAGELLGELPASCSFHLRQLARYGLVEEAGGGVGRRRPWRATARATTWPALPAGPATVLGDRFVHLTAEELADLGERIRALTEPYLERTANPERRPEGSRPVAVITLGFPADGADPGAR
jgi:DNA-binding transcriptional ArsR family regulator